MSPTTTEPRPRRLVGIDLGTTNSALAWTDDRGAIHIFDVPQLSAPAEIARLPTLPSFLYFPTDADQQGATVALPWRTHPDVVAGIFARDQGALVPDRQIASAKSWLANPAVDRTARLLPWGVDEGPRLSPVEASSRILAHLRDAWNQEGPGDGAAGPAHLQTVPIVLTVPASFDEEARELTLQAADDAGLGQVTLIEEPIAALYAWIAAHRRQLAEHLPNGALVLVCDVGGGTTDFSLMRASTTGDDLQFERIAIGEHLLLGGDNLDLALAALVERKLTDAGAPKLSLTQRLALRRKCSAAKESLLSNDSPERVTITVLGSGRGVIGGGLTADLTRAEAVSTLLDGFLPVVEKHDVPARDRRLGLRELGLPYEPEPAITRHLAAFLARATRGDSETAGLPVPDRRALQRRLLHAGSGADAGPRCAPLVVRNAADGAREPTARSGRRDGRRVLRATAGQSRGREASVHPRRQRTRLLCGAAHRGRPTEHHLRHAEGHGRRHHPRPRSQVRRHHQPAHRFYALQLHTRARQPERHRRADQPGRVPPARAAGDRPALRPALTAGQPGYRPAHRLHRDRHPRAVV